MVRAFSRSVVDSGKGPRLTTALVRVSMCSLHRAPTAYKVGAGMSDDGMMHSDHRPVFVDFKI